MSSLHPHFLNWPSYSMNCRQFIILVALSQDTFHLINVFLKRYYLKLNVMFQIWSDQRRSTWDISDLIQSLLCETREPPRWSQFSFRIILPMYWRSSSWSLWYWSIPMGHCLSWPLNQTFPEKENPLHHFARRIHPHICVIVHLLSLCESPFLSGLSATLIAQILCYSPRFTTIEH